MDKVGKYLILGKLGQGGMGVVYRALDPLLERVVALKTISAHLDSQPELRARFFREGRSAAHLSHKNIITIYDIGEDNGVAYLAMEYLEGQDLKAKITQRVSFSLQKKLWIMMELCEGLAHAHRRQVIHRDIKPANIFMSNSGQIKILDFGLARMVSGDITRTGAPLGTPNYMSPEQVRGERIDHRADIFSAGAVLYELIALRRPFNEDSVPATILKILQSDPEPLEKIDPSIDPALTSTVMRALAKEPESRFQSAEEMLAELRRFAATLLPAPEDESTSVETVRSWTGEVLDLPTIETPVEARSDLATSGDEARVYSASASPASRKRAQAEERPGSGSQLSPAVGGVPASQPPAAPAKHGKLTWVAAVALLAVISSSVWWVFRTPRTIAGSGDSPAGQPGIVAHGGGNRAVEAPASRATQAAAPSGATSGEGPSTPGTDSAADDATSPAGSAFPLPHVVPKTARERNAPLAGGRQISPPPGEAAKTAAAQHDPGAAAQVQLAAAARKAAEEALRQMTQSRSRAESAGAPQFAAKSYEAARKIEVEARALYDSGQYDKAGPRLYETSGLYSSAALEAESQKEAAARQAEQQRDVALRRSQAEQARQAFDQSMRTAEAAGTQLEYEPAKFQAASNLAAQAQAAFAQQDYSTAKHHWETAAETMDQARASAAQLARVPAPPPPAPDTPPKAVLATSPETERQLIAAVLQQYAAALRSRDLAALKAVWPGLSGKQEQAFRDEFRNARDIGVQLLDLRIEPNGDAATATGRRMYVLQTNDGRTLENPSRMAVTLRKSAGKWLLDKIRFEPLR